MTENIRVFAGNISDHHSGFAIPNRQRGIKTIPLGKTPEGFICWVVPKNLSVPQKVNTFTLTIFFHLPSRRVTLLSPTLKTPAINVSLESSLLYKSYRTTTSFWFFSYYHLILLLVHCMCFNRVRIRIRIRTIFYFMKTSWLISF